MERAELIALCLSFPGAYEDYPFSDTRWTVIRHHGNKKVFAYVYEREGELCINLKCEPLRADFLRGVYSGVRPGYHMNKEHWNTVVMDSDVPLEELEEMIRESHALTRRAPNAGRKKTTTEAQGGRT